MPGTALGHELASGPLLARPLYTQDRATTIRTWSRNVIPSAAEILLRLQQVVEEGHLLPSRYQTVRLLVIN